MDALLANVDSRDPVKVSVDEMIGLFGALGIYDSEDWDKAKFCVDIEYRRPIEFVLH